jgi:hypothetical protein
MDALQIGSGGAVRECPDPWSDANRTRGAFSNICSNRVSRAVTTCPCRSLTGLRVAEQREQVVTARARDTPVERSFEHVLDFFEHLI